MPEISLFYGIRVTMYYNDHMPPHFHAEYNGQKALVDINNIQVIRGSLPNKQLRLILAWCTIPVSYTHLDVYKRQTYTTGVAVMKACEELKKKICKLGAEMMEVDERKVDFDGSCVFYDETLETDDEMCIRDRVLISSMYFK